MQVVRQLVKLCELSQNFARDDLNLDIFLARLVEHSRYNQEVPYER